MKIINDTEFIKRLVRDRLTRQDAIQLSTDELHAIIEVVDRVGRDKCPLNARKAYDAARFELVQHRGGI